MSISDFFAALNESDIFYFHFKSTQHLDKSFRGKTDFDIYVDRHHYQKFQSLLVDWKFKRRISLFNNEYFNVEDFLMYDSGEIHHLHVHYELSFGRKFRKNNYFKNIDLFKNNTELHQNLPIRIIIPELELILLIIRSVLKKESIPAEYSFLCQRINNDTLKQLVQDHFPDLKEYIDKYILQGKYNNTIGNIKFRYELSKYSRYERYYSFVYFFLRKIFNKIPCRYFIGGVKTIAIVGSDGSGKSSITKDIQRFLCYKISAKQEYLGLDKKSQIATFFKVLGGFFNRITQRKGNNIFHILAYRKYAMSRLNRINKAQKASQRGIITIFDRYPLQEFESIMSENPMDRSRSDSPKELDIYARMPKYPDLLIILNADLSVVRNRLGTSIPGNISEKVDAVKKLSSVLPSDCRYIEIDANREYEFVLESIKEQIWNTL